MMAQFPYFVRMVLVLAAIIVAAQEPDELLSDRPVVVNLPDFGRVQGRRQTGIDKFLGLPYAAPPVGPLRWAPPEMITPWAPAKLDASHFGPDCWQIADPLANPNAHIHQMSEDCLYLNIYTPAGQAQQTHTDRHHHRGGNSNLLPVVVWLHGGAFQQGGARRPEFDGRRLAERGTVVVTLNYRLGALGFLVSSSDGLFGNFGLMDQRAALHWIQDNIEHFGGDPGDVTLFGESAGAVMTGLHLLMEGVGKLFHKAVIQSNPLGLQFRSVVVQDFLGEALKRSVDCRDLACLRAERVEEIMRAQSSLMGVPRSVGDFFTWGPTLTEEWKVTLGASSSRTGSGRGGSRKNGIHRHDRSPFGPASNKQRSSSPLGREHQALFSDIDAPGTRWQSNKNNRVSTWADVNVTQPLTNLHLIPHDIPVVLGANKHEGELFVHGAFPITMSKTVYWMFVGALFRDSASRVLKHYRGYVDQIEKEAKELALRRVEEEENRQYYLENKEQLDSEYQLLIDKSKSGWSRGGATVDDNDDNNNGTCTIPWYRHFLPSPNITVIEGKKRLREEKRRARAKERALKAAAKVVVDYRPVMSRIIDDYLFRCPTWHLAHSLSRNRLYRGNLNNVYVYQFSHSTHIPGYEECWGKSCHSAEVPYVFQAMDIIRTNYSTLGPHAQAEAPVSPEYHYTDMLEAYRGVAETTDGKDEGTTASHSAANDKTTSASSSTSSSSSAFQSSSRSGNTTHSLGFQRILKHFFGDYFKEDADEEISSDMADRWVAFAQTGDPNYETSKAKWLPWRYEFEDDYHQNDNHNGRMWSPEDLDAVFDLDIDYDGDDNSTDGGSIVEGFIWSSDPEQRTYRKRALAALGMEVVEEDVFQTMLRRTSRKRSVESENPIISFLFGTSSANKPEDNADHEQMKRRARWQLQQMAQDMGVLGSGLRGEDRRAQSGPDTWEEGFFPQMLELKWPPESRLIERDCTCDMWDRLRYRY